MSDCSDGGASECIDVLAWSGGGAVGVWGGEEGRGEGCPSLSGWLVMLVGEVLGEEGG